MSGPKDTTIGFVGLGLMGFGMATHLVKQGYKVKGYDVFPKSVERFGQAGGVMAKSLQDSARDADIYICMVANAVQAQEALFDHSEAVVPALPRGATLLITSTVPATYAQSMVPLLEQLNRHDIFLVDCPVSGGSFRAADGSLSIMVGGSEAAIAKATPILQVLSDTNKLFIVPGGVGGGSNLKMVHQVLAGIQILAASEAMGFAARLGLDPDVVRKRVLKSDAWSWMFEHRTVRMLTEDYYPGSSALTIILKDVGIITDQARLRNFPTPLNSAAEQTYLTGLSLGWGSHDDAGMVRLYFPEPLKTIAPSADTENKINLVITLLHYIHIVSAAEAIAFAHELKMDLSQFYELVIDAAGGSLMFMHKGEKMIRGIVQNAFSAGKATFSTEVREGSKGMKGDGTIEDAVREMGKVVQAARDVHCPLFLGTVALSLFTMAKRKGKGKEGDDCIIQMWQS